MKLLWYQSHKVSIWDLKTISVLIYQAILPSMETFKNYPTQKKKKKPNPLLQPQRFNTNKWVSQTHRTIKLTTSRETPRGKRRFSSKLWSSSFPYHRSETSSLRRHWWRAVTQHQHAATKAPRKWTGGKVCLATASISGEEISHPPRKRDGDYSGRKYADLQWTRQGAEQEQAGEIHKTQKRRGCEIFSILNPIYKETPIPLNLQKTQTHLHDPKTYDLFGIRMWRGVGMSYSTSINCGLLTRGWVNPPTTIWFWETMNLIKCMCKSMFIPVDLWSRAHRCPVSRRVGRSEIMWRIVTA